LDKFVIKEPQVTPSDNQIQETTIAIESEMLEKIDYEYIIEDFISKNTHRIMLFK
jgi:hypothetical protein